VDLFTAERGQGDIGDAEVTSGFSSAHIGSSKDTKQQ
jgi:hypothetical protein